MPSDDNVMDLLDSLDVKQGQKSKPKKSSSKRKEPKKATGDDILGFLDELDKKKQQEAEKAQDQPKKDHPVEKNSEQQQETAEHHDYDSDDSEGGIDPVASLTSWWSNKGGLWSKAQSTIQDAMHDAVKQARSTEASLREEQAHFSLNSLQNRLTSVLNTIIPPISHHEQLKIHIFHDMVGYPSVDKLLYEVFDYVMDQVEGGGDLNMVAQKGKERHRAGSDYDVHRSLNLVRCSLDEAAKLAKANVESIPTVTQDNETKDPNIRISEVYVSIQPVIAPSQNLLSQQTTTEALYFIVYLQDPEHNIDIFTTSQAMPVEWAQWLDSDGLGFREAAIDPREWVFGWVEDALNLSFGVAVQKYVTTRMGLTKEGKTNAEPAGPQEQSS